MQYTWSVHLNYDSWTTFFPPSYKTSPTGHTHRRLIQEKRFASNNPAPRPASTRPLAKSQIQLQIQQHEAGHEGDDFISVFRRTRSDSAWVRRSMNATLFCLHVSEILNSTLIFLTIRGKTLMPKTSFNHFGQQIESRIPSIWCLLTHPSLHPAPLSGSFGGCSCCSRGGGGSGVG